MPQPPDGCLATSNSTSPATDALETVWRPQNLRVPRDDETLFAEPALRESLQATRSNHEELEHAEVDLQGRTLSELRRWTRDAVLQAARRYTSELTGHDEPAGNPELLYVGGHQPSLYHPGVWAKNFAIDALARHGGGRALNLVIDNDTVSTMRIRVPAGDRAHPSIDTIPFDAARPTQPWESADIVDRDLFRSFGDRVARAMRHWKIDPVARSMWPDAVDHMQRTARLVDCLTAGRHRLERRWGLSNLEVPISRVCRLDPFLWFSSHLLAHLPRFREIHNEVLQQYRRVNHVRSRTHPVPELQESDGWLEAPFWVWRTGDMHRGRLLARQVDREMWLSDGQDVFAKLPLSPEMDACCAVEALRELPAQGIHLRTRALTTTLFSRLCLSDLFVHGIGGAKYDEMTDRIIARFFGIRPPRFLTLSATLQLPFSEPYDVEPDDERRLTRLLRDCRYNPQRHLPGELDGRAAELAAKKQRLIAEQHAAATHGLTRSQRRRRARDNYERYHRFQEVNEQLAEFTREQRQSLEGELQDVRRKLEANALFQDREFSFCLYPEDKIRPFMTEIWRR